MIFIKEIWKDIKGFEGFYQVSNKGRVKSLSREVEYMGRKRILNERIRKPREAGSITKYLRINLFRGEGKPIEKLIHVLVVETFIGEIEEGKVINHIDGNPLNNDLNNLEIVTHSENMNDMYQRIKKKRMVYKYEVLDTKTGYIKEFDSSIKLGNEIGLSSASVRHYASGLWEGLAKNRYKITREEAS